jgi:hypothetical protein
MQSAFSKISRVSRGYPGVETYPSTKMVKAALRRYTVTWRPLAPYGEAGSAAVRWQLDTGSSAR